MRVAKTHPIYAQLAAGAVKSPYNWALSYWFNPPVIHGIQRMGNLIRVEASDNVMVAKVQVTILDAERKVLEQGQAVQGFRHGEQKTNRQPTNSGWWEYVPSK